jgi:hypothetical protein
MNPSCHGVFKTYETEPTSGENEMKEGSTLFEIDRELDSLLDQIEEEAEETGAASQELL